MYSFLLWMFLFCLEFVVWDVCALRAASGVIRQEYCLFKRSYKIFS